MENLCVARLQATNTYPFAAVSDAIFRKVGFVIWFASVQEVAVI